MICFFNDQFIEEDKVAISINDRGFTLGDGVFDTQLAVAGHLEDADQHFERLHHDTAIMVIELSKDVAELKTIAAMLLATNHISTGRWIIRTEVTRGPALRGLAIPDHPHPTIVMRAVPASPQSDMPMRTIIAQTTRRNEHSPLSRIKSLNYGDNLLALLEARDFKAEDAILLNSEHNTCCATTSNIFIVEKNKWVTPPLSDGCLPGITRRKIITQNNAYEDHISPERLKAADEIWQCNSVIGLKRIELLAY